MLHYFPTDNYELATEEIRYSVSINFAPPLTFLKMKISSPNVVFSRKDFLQKQVEI